MSELSDSEGDGFLYSKNVGEAPLKTTTELGNPPYGSGMMDDG